MKAYIEFNGDIFEKNEYEGDTPTEIIYQLMRDQDLDCLIRMGPMYNDDVSQLKKFVDKYHNGILTVDDIKSLNIELSIGTIKCVKFED